MTGYVLVDGVAHMVRGREAASARTLNESLPLPPAGEGPIIASDGDILWVHLSGRAYAVEYKDAVTHLAAVERPAASMRAPMPGSVIAANVVAGDSVAAGEMVMIIESMKLETVIRAPQAGVIATVHYAVGDRFDRDAVLVSLVEAD